MLNLSTKIRLDDFIPMTQLCIQKNAATSGAIRASQQMLDKIIAWCETNCVSINETKTQYMIFNDKQTVSEVAPSKVVCNNSTLKLVDKFTYLGVEVDKNLDFDDHVNKLVKQANRKL